MTLKRSRSIASTRHMGNLTQSPEALKIAQRTAEIVGNKSIAESVELSATILTRMRQMLEKGGTIVTDSSIMYDAIDSKLLENTNASLKCFIDTAETIKLAERKMTSRAEVAVDTALLLPGPKLMVIGSAPAALNRIIQRRTIEPLNDVCIITAVSGFVSAIALKERLRDSNITYGVVRGKNGGLQVTAALVNAVLEFINNNP